jgi:hypothetical protein
MVLLDRKERSVSKVLREILAQLAQLALTAQQDLMDPQGQLVHRVFKAQLETLETKAQQGLRDQQDQQVHKVFRV